MRLNSSKQAQAPLCASPAAQILAMRPCKKKLMQAPAPPLAVQPPCGAEPSLQQIQSTKPQQRLHSNAESAHTAESAAKPNQSASSDALAAQVGGDAELVPSLAVRQPRPLAEKLSRAGPPARSWSCCTVTISSSSRADSLQTSHCWATLWSPSSCKCRRLFQACD